MQTIMEITDFNGNVIKITDLSGAIKQAKEFSNYRHADKGYRKSDCQLSVYWKDILKKLLALKTQQANKNKKTL